MLKLVLNFAVDEEWIESNPAAKMKELKVGEWRDWTDEECTVFEQRWPAGTISIAPMPWPSTPASAKAMWSR